MAEVILRVPAQHVDAMRWYAQRELRMAAETVLAEVETLNRQMDGEHREARWADLESSERTYANTKHVLAQLDALEAGDSDEVALSGDPRALAGILTFLLESTGSEIERATADHREDDREGYFAQVGRLADLLTWATEKLAWLEAEEARVERAERELVAA